MEQSGPSTRLVCKVEIIIGNAILILLNAVGCCILQNGGCYLQPKATAKIFLISVFIWL